MKVMIGDVIRDLVRDMDRRVDEGDLGQPFLSSHNYRAYPFDPQNFTPIRPVEPRGKVAYIDGGNRELLGAPNFSIQLNRVYFNVFRGSRRLSGRHLPQRIEFLSTTFTEFKADEIYFSTLLHPVHPHIADYLPDSADLSFRSTDRRVMAGISRGDVAHVATIARRFAEWAYARRLVEQELDRDDVLVMDGTLRTVFQHEAKYANAAYDAATRRGVVFSGLSKTSRLFTTTGLSLLASVRKLAEESGVSSTWYYYPIAKSLSPEHQGAIIIVKLNEHSKRVFNYELFAEQFKAMEGGAINAILSQLCVNARDASFPGYPYGLIDADDQARVRLEEAQTYRLRLLSEVSKLGAWPKFSRHIQSTDAHSVLNMLSGGRQ